MTPPGTGSISSVSSTIAARTLSLLRGYKPLLWSMANAAVWRRDQDAITSIFKLLKENEKTEHCILHSMNLY